MKHQRYKNGSFIVDSKYYLHDKSAIHLVSCNFDKFHYKAELFTLLNIYFPEEIMKSIVKRQAEFLVGRYVAKQALLYAGYNSSESPIIHIGKNRCPIWPDGFIGSISHNDNKAVCVVGKQQELRYVGIDIEDYISEKTASEIQSQVHTMAEKALVIENGYPAEIATPLIFSAKESLFKALYPATKSYFGFDVAKVVYIDAEKNQLHLELLTTFSAKHNLPGSYLCKFELNDDHILTLVVVS